jgi:hypothetical protein
MDSNSYVYIHSQYYDVHDCNQVLILRVAHTSTCERHRLLSQVIVNLQDHLSHLQFLVLRDLG